MLIFAVLYKDSERVGYKGGMGDRIGGQNREANPKRSLCCGSPTLPRWAGGGEDGPKISMELGFTLLMGDLGIHGEICPGGSITDSPYT